MAIRILLQSGSQISDDGFHAQFNNHIYDRLYYEKQQQQLKTIRSDRAHELPLEAEKNILFEPEAFEIPHVKKEDAC